MEFLFDILAEIIMEPIIEGYIYAMMCFTGERDKIDKTKIQIIVGFECVALIIMFLVGGAILLETKGESIWGKALLFSSAGVSVLQIIIGCVLRRINKGGQEL